MIKLTGFAMTVGMFLTVFIISSAQLSGNHTSDQGVLDGWAMAFSGTAMLVSLFALWFWWDE